MIVENILLIGSSIVKMRSFFQLEKFFIFIPYSQLWSLLIN